MRRRPRPDCACGHPRWQQAAHRGASMPWACPGTQVIDAAEVAWGKASLGVKVAAAPLGTRLVEVLSGRCGAALKPMRGIATTYRMVNRPMPTRPSPYVSAVLQPLRCAASPLGSPLPVQHSNFHRPEFSESPEFQFISTHLIHPGGRMISRLGQAPVCNMQASASSCGKMPPVPPGPAACCDDAVAVPMRSPLQPPVAHPLTRVPVP